jgi:hypothetical protein
LDTAVREIPNPEFPAATPDAVQLAQRLSACRSQVFSRLTNRSIMILPRQTAFARSNLRRIFGLLELRPEWASPLDEQR